MTVRAIERYTTELRKAAAAASQAAADGDGEDDGDGAPGSPTKRAKPAAQAAQGSALDPASVAAAADTLARRGDEAEARKRVGESLRQQAEKFPSNRGRRFSQMPPLLLS